MKLARVIILILILTGIILYIPPIHWLSVFIFISLLSLLVSYLSAFFLPKKYSPVIFLTIFILLTLLALDLFDIINLILTISLIIGILILVK